MNKTMISCQMCNKLLEIEVQDSVALVEEHVQTGVGTFCCNCWRLLNSPADIDNMIARVDRVLEGK